MDWTSFSSLLLEPFQYVFIRRGLIEALMMGGICGAMGAFVVARGWGFIGDAISHAIFPGVVIAYLGRFNFSLGALAFGVLTALGIGALSHTRRLKEDTVIGVLFAGAFSLGVVLISSIRSYATDLGAILFGNILGVSDQDLLLTFGLGLLVLVLLFLTYKELLLVSFDRTMAAAMGLRVAWLDQLLLLLLTLTIIVSLQAVGNILVVAMLITPAATARLVRAALPQHDGPGQHHWRAVRPRRPVRLVLPQPRFGWYNRAGRYARLWPRFRLCAPHRPGSRTAPAPSRRPHRLVFSRSLGVASTLIPPITRPPINLISFPTRTFFWDFYSPAGLFYRPIISFRALQNHPPPERNYPNYSTSYLGSFHGPFLS